MAATLIGLCAQQAAAQCTLNGGPNQFEPAIGGADKPPRLVAGFTDQLSVFDQGGRKKLMVTENFGYGTFDLQAPLAPVALGYQDMIATIPLAGDGQSTVTALGVADDGSRALVSWKQSPYGTFLMRPTTSIFGFAGCYGPPRGGGTVVQRKGSRYLGFTLTAGTLVVADVTTLLSTGATQAGSIQSESIQTVTINSVASDLTAVGDYAVFANGTEFVVIDAGNAGPPGNITSGLSFRSYSTAEFGLPGADRISGLGAGIHPSNGDLYVLAETTASGTVSGVALARISSSGSLTKIGSTYLPPAPYSSGGGISAGAVTAISTGDDLYFYFWELAGSTWKLFTLSANGWGQDLSPTVTVNTTSVPNFATVRDMEGFYSGGTTYLYIAAKQAGYAMALSCVASNSPATADLKVEPDPCPSGTSCPLADNATVFVGDKLKVTTTINPPPSSVSLNGWQFDYDFHLGNAIEDAGSGSNRIKLPDVSGGSGSTPPSTLTFYGPCDPSTANANPQTGSGCWTSVTTNSATGGPDFTGSAEGTTKSLRIALQAANSFGSAGIKTVALNWKIPAVKVKNTSVLLGQSLQDGSEGHPSTTGYKWYFSPQPNLTGDVLQQDTSCTGPTCNHTFPSKGTYRYWLTVPYPNGYTSPDCGGTCTSSKGSITVTDVVVDFNAPSQVLLGSGTFSVVDESTKAGSVTSCPSGSAGYEYRICDVGGGGCGNWQSFGGSSIPTPGNAGSYWLYIRYNYSTTGTGGCGAPLQAPWTPNVVADANAWPFTVANVVPSIVIAVNGNNPCAPGPGGSGGTCGGDFSANVNDTLTAYAYVNGAQDQNPPSGLAWTFGGNATPSSAQGQGVTFRYNSSGNVTVTMSGYGATLSVNGTVSAVVTPPPPPPQLTITRITANPSPGTVNQPVQFSASVSGGSPGYTYSWAFGDNSTSTSIAPSKVFATTGVYTVRLTVRDSVGAQTASSISFSVGSGTTQPQPIDFSIYDSATGSPVLFQASFGTFFATSGQALRFQAFNITSALVWSFGDTVDNSSSTNPAVHTYTTPVDKTYTVTLTSGGQTKSYKVDVTGSGGLTGTYSYSYTDGTTVKRDQVPYGKSIRFTATDVADVYSWDFGDGTPNASGRVVEHPFTRAGAFTVVLTVAKGSNPTVATPAPLSFTVLAPPEPPLWLLGGMAYTDGLSGTLWLSDMTIFNPDSTRGQALSLAFLDGQKNVDPAQLRWNQVILNPLQTISYRNVLNNPPFALGKGNFGAILVRGDDISIFPVVTGRTYNTGGGNGTYGLSVPAVPVTGGVRAQAASASNVLIGLKEKGDRYRTNLTLVNLKSDFATAEIRFYDKLGAPLGGVARIDLAPYGVHQVNRVLVASNGAGYAGESDSFVAEIKVVTGTAVFPYATVIDGKSGDPIVITPSVDPVANYRLPGVVRTRGRNNTLFQSDVAIYNPSDQQRRVSVKYWYQSFRADESPSVFQSAVKELTMKPREVVDFEDFVKGWLPSGTDLDNTSFANSFVDIAPAAGDPVTDPLLVLGETYNAQESGNAGFQVPGFTSADAVSAAGASRRLVMTGLSTGTASRTNVAFFLTSPSPNVYGSGTVRVVGADGTVLRSQTIFLTDVQSFTQINDADLFAGLSGDLTNVTVVLENVAGTSPIASYATVVDNGSGDAILITGRPAL